MSIQLVPTIPRFLEEDRHPNTVPAKISTKTSQQIDLSKIEMSAPVDGTENINFGVRHLIRAWCCLLVFSFSSSDEEYYKICGSKYGPPKK